MANENKKSREQLERQVESLQVQLRFNWTDRLAGGAVELTRWLVIAFIAYEIQKTFGEVTKDIAGKNTEFNFNLSISISLAFSLALNGLQFLERGRLKKNFTARIDELQKRLDPGKQSSGLRPDGGTHPRDVP